MIPDVRERPASRCSKVEGSSPRVSASGYLDVQSTSQGSQPPVAQSVRGVEGRITRQIRNRRGTKNG